MTAMNYRMNRPSLHAEGGVCSVMAMALQIFRAFGNRQPTVAELCKRFDMSRATAYRWRAAWLYVHGAALTPGVPSKHTPKLAEATQ